MPYKELNFHQDTYSAEDDPFFDQDHYLSDPDFSDLDFNDYGGEAPDLMLDVPYVPTDTKIVAAILDFAQVTSQDRLYDLGCGDGRIVVTAALERGTHGVGIDLDPARVADAMELAGNTAVENLVTFYEDDLLEAEISPATVVTLYLLDLVNVQLRPRLLDELRPGTRIVSHAFNMGDWKADRRKNLGSVNLYLWIVPAKVAGCWQWQDTQGNNYKVELKQKYQRITGNAWLNDQPIALKNALLKGDLLELVFKEDQGRPYSFVMRYHNDQLQPADSTSTQAAPAVRCPSET